MPRNNKPLPSQEHLRQIFAYDADTGVLTWREREFNSLLANGWNTKYANKVAGVKNSAGYLIVGIDGNKFLAHRIVWKWLHGTEPLIVDHIDGDTTNNCATNLREATESLSMFNRRLCQGRLPRGVQPNGNRFAARIANKHLGTYATPDEAHEVYCLAAEMLYAPTAAFPNN